MNLCDDWLQHRPNTKQEAAHIVVDPLHVLSIVETSVAHNPTTAKFGSLRRRGGWIRSFTFLLSQAVRSTNSN
jgi:hypothetical protein